LVEDDAVCRYATSRRLRSEGHTVLAAKDAAEAIDISNTWQGKIDLLCTDIRLPGLNGPDLAARILKDRPQLATLYITGYPDATDALIKPFTEERLSAAVQTALGRSAVESSPGSWNEI